MTHKEAHMPKIARPTSVIGEDYLTTIFRFAEEGRPIIAARLAEILSVSPATAFGMLKRMARDKLVELSRSKEIALTSKGQQIAAGVIRRHRLSERFLSEILHLEWHKIYNEAHRFEHAISPEVADRLKAVLGNPTTCPHGYSIPYTSAPQSDVATRPLNQLTEGEESIVYRVPEDDTELLMFLEANDIKPGLLLKVTEVASFKGTITLSAKDWEIVISTDTAAKIMMKA